MREFGAPTDCIRRIVIRDVFAIIPQSRFTCNGENLVGEGFGEIFVEFPAEERSGVFRDPSKFTSLSESSRSSACFLRQTMQ